jgi:chorismate mutase
VSEPAAESLAQLRIDIDRIDASMHALLMERGRIIDRLIAIKARQGGGSAFRPAREAAMMKALAERHQGLLPLDTVESIWRIIISTFTYVQSPYSVHVDVSRGDAAMRDSARFHFGFTVPCMPHMSASGVIEAVAAAGGDVGMFAIDGGPGAGAWWMRLADAAAPKVIARLPTRRRRGARCRARGGHPRSLARRLPPGDRGTGRRDRRQRRRRHGLVLAYCAPRRIARGRCRRRLERRGGGGRAQRRDRRARRAF